MCWRWLQSSCSVQSQSLPNTFHKFLFQTLFSVTFKKHQLRHTKNYLKLLNKEDLNLLPSPYLYVSLVWELVIHVLMRQQLFWGITVSWENLLIDSNTEENVYGTETNTEAYYSTNMHTCVTCPLVITSHQLFFFCRFCLMYGLKQYLSGLISINFLGSTAVFLLARFICVREEKGSLTGPSTEIWMPAGFHLLRLRLLRKKNLQNMEWHLLAGMPCFLQTTVWDASSATPDLTLANYPLMANCTEITPDKIFLFMSFCSFKSKSFH